MAAAAFFTSAFGVSAVLHLGQAVYFKTKCMIPLVVGAFFETVGYIMRSGDVASFLIQSYGGSMVSKPTATESSKKAGQQIVLAGLVVQVAFGVLFTIVAGVFHRRICKAFTAAGVSQEIRWLMTLYGVMVLVTIRNIFRIAEHSGGQESSLMKHEYLPYLLDASPILLALLWFNCEASGWYKTKATAHWQAAVRLATPRLAAIDAESCDPLFIFAMLSCLQTFALGPQPGNFLLFTDDSEMEWPIFFRGLRTVAEASVLFGMTEPARPLAFMYGIAKLDLETLPPHEPVTSWGTALRNLRQIMMNEVSGEEERAVYQDALRRLRAGFAAVFGDSDTVGGANSQVNTIAENFGGSTAASLGSHQFSLDDCPDLTSKIGVVTGGSEGIGYGITHTLLKHNIAKLYILSVSKEVVEGAQDAIAKDLGTEKANRTKWFQCDMSDWKRVKEVAEAIKNDADRLDILVNNAGRGIMSAELTDYGVDRHMALNHMGHVVLTSHLLPLIKETAEKGNVVRIVNQASNAHQAAPSDVKFESLEELNKDLGPNGQYGRSKLANILYARYFARNVTQNGHPNVLMNATHPGFVSTKMSKEDIFEPYPLGGYAMAVGMEPFKKSQWEGAVSAVFAATAIKESGQYICPPAIPEAGNKLAQDEKLADQLMELTRKIITEKTKSQSVDKGCPMDDLVLH
ncbi:putative oxidoreductase bli-4 [Colletotrichum sp. SAR11_59]|nr:putative oxidoreductase bli-4 [Colletotrichum sp. SAR11_59]